MAARQQQGESTFTELGIPSLGMDTDTVPRLLPPTKAPLLKNFLLDRPGILPMRGPLCEATTWDAGASIGLLGCWQFDDKLLVSRYAASATATRDYWVGLYRYTNDPLVPRHGSTTLKHVDLSTGVATDVVAAARLNIPGLRSVRVGDYVYGPGGDTTVLTLVRATGGYIPRTKLLKWDGTAAAPVAYVNAPLAAQDVAYHYNRLFVLGGVNPDGTGTVRPNTLWWTDQLPTDGTALPDVLTSWQDDVSGLVNQLVIGAEDGQDCGVAVAHVGSNLCVLKRRSLWMLYGTSPSNFQVRQLSNEVGCIDPRSVVEYDGGVYFMSDRGFMFFDGTKARHVSVGLNSTLVANALKQVGPKGVDGGYCRATLLDRGYLLVATGVVDGATITATADTDSWLLHAPSGAWEQLSSGALPAAVSAGRTVNNTWLMTDQKLAKANYLFNPNAAPASTRGFDSIDSGATKFVIPSRWTTRALSLGTPPRKSKLQRIVADYYWSLANGGWQVTANTRGATGVVNTAATLAAPSAIAATLPARGAINNFNETDEVYLDIAATSSAPATFNDAELHRVVLESQQSYRAPAAL